MQDKLEWLDGRFQASGKPGQVPLLIPAVDTRNGSPVLVRVIKPCDPPSLTRLMRDARLLSRLRHAGLARILDVCEEDGKVLIILDPIRGRTLSVAAVGSTTPLPLLLQAMEQLAGTLEFLHGQDPPIYLGRLDPAGILLTPGDQVLIADVASDELEMLETRTSPYWAPEVEVGTPASAAQDLYSLGAIAWLLATGSPPGSGRMHDDLPASMVELIQHLLQVEPDHRPSSARQVLARLAAIRGEGAPIARKQEEGPSKAPASKVTMWDVLFAPLGRTREQVQPKAIPDDDGEAARKAREQFSVLDLASVELEREVARILPETVARSIQGVVVARPAQDELVVALKDPTFVHAYDYVRLAVGHSFQVRLSRAQPEMVDQALEYVYRSEIYSESVSWAEWLVRRRYHLLPLVVENPIANTSMWGEPLPNRVIDAVDTILKEALAVGASDIHFETFRRWMDVRYRIDGVLKSISSYSTEQANAMVKRIKVLANMDIAQERVPQGGRISVRVGDLECDLRVSVVPVQGGESAVLRVLRKTAEQLTLTELGFPEDLQTAFGEVLQQPYGMILIAGPTGSGKTTTLYSALKILQRPDRKLLTVEDPIEYEMAGVTQVQVDTSPREVEKRVTFARVLREFLRQDPDVILVGEIRDPETADIAVQAALTGHLVLSTLHANDAPGVFARLHEMGVEPFLVGSALLAAVSQRLARRICPDCRQETQVPATMQERMRAAGIAGPRAYRGRGCPKCLGSGCRGRVGLYEMARVSTGVRRSILEGAGENELIEVLEAEGSFRRLHDHGLQMAAAGLVSLDEVLRVTLH